MVLAVESVMEESVAPERGSMLSQMVSSAVAGMIKNVIPSVVQVRSGGRGAGAGFVWKADGGILTNYHVVAGGPGPVNVLLSDGRSVEGKVAAYNRALDLALLEVEASDLPAALIGDSTKLRTGELVFAVGHPWGQKDVVTAGIVSGLGKVEVPRTGRTAQYIRSDVQVGPGNSGGPLLDARGTVVGITAMIFGGDLTIAIPSHVASTWVAGEPTRRVYLGVGVQPVELPESFRNNGWAARPAGLMVVAVDPSGPANRAGLLVGDVLLTLGGEPVDDEDTLVDALAAGASKAKFNGRASLQLQVVRAGSLRTIDVDLSAKEQSA